MKTHRFRPLSGSYISQYFNFSITRMIEVFPSPIGELHFSIFNIIFILFQLFGFRPLSGSYISQSRWVNAKKLRVETVSVPYRGATFLNWHRQHHKYSSYWFPSPIGELHFSIELYSVHDEKFDIKFPSPIGELHFSIMFANLIISLLCVSVPYRGATFLNLT